MSRSTFCYIICVAIAGLSLVTVATLHAANWVNYGTSKGLFQKHRYNSWVTEKLSFINPKWIMNLWVANYIYQFVWLIYGVTLVCQRTEVGTLHHQPCLVPKIVYILTTLGNLSILAWFGLWDRNLMVQLSIIPITGAAIFYYIGLIYTSNADNKASYLLHRLDIFWIQRTAQGFVHNGLMFHATLCSVFAMFQFCLVLKHQFGLQSQVASLFLYPFFLTHMITLFSFEVCVFQYRLRYFYSQYIVYIIIPMAAIFLLRDVDTSGDFITGQYRELHLILLGVCGVLSVVCLLLKAAIAFGRRHHTPRSMSPSKPYPTITSRDRTEQLSLYAM